MNVTPEMIDTNCEKDVDIIAKLEKMENQIVEVNQKLTSLQNQVNQVNQNIRIEFTNLRNLVTQTHTKVNEIHYNNTPAWYTGREQPANQQPCTIL